MSDSVDTVVSSKVWPRETAIDTSNSVSGEKQDHFDYYEKDSVSDGGSQEESYISSFLQFCARNRIVTALIILNVLFFLMMVVGFGFLGYKVYELDQRTSSYHPNDICNHTEVASDDDNDNNLTLTHMQLDGILALQKVLQNQLDSLTNRTNALQRLMQANVSRLEDKLRNFGEQIANISEQLQVWQPQLAQIVEVDDQLNSFNTSLGIFSTQLTTFGSQLNSLNSSQTTHTSEIQSLQSDLSGLRSQVSELPQEISSSFEQRFSDIDDQIDSVKLVANGASNKVNLFGNRLSTLEDKVNGAIVNHYTSFVLFFSFVMFLLFFILDE